MTNFYTRLHQALILTVFLLPLTAQAGVEHMLYQVETPTCVLVAKHDAVADQPGVLVVKAQDRKNKSCKIDIQQMSTFIERALYALSRQPSLAPISSIYLGRLIHYPWISYELKIHAMNPTIWDKNLGKAVNMHENEFVNQYLINSKRLKSLGRMIKLYGIHITAASCEKVLLNNDYLPYDAMCWLEVKPTAENPNQTSIKQTQ